MRSSVVGVVGSIGERQYSQRGVVKRSYHVDEAVSSLDVRLHCRHDVRLAADSSNGSAAEAMAAAVASAPVTASPSGRGTPDTPSASPAFGTRPTQLTL